MRAAWTGTPTSKNDPLMGSGRWTIGGDVGILPVRRREADWSIRERLCHLSSAVERSFRKAQVVGSNPTGGFDWGITDGEMALDGGAYSGDRGGGIPVACKHDARVPLGFRRVGERTNQAVLVDLGAELRHCLGRMSLRIVGLSVVDVEDWIEKTMPIRVKYAKNGWRGSSARVSCSPFRLFPIGHGRIRREA